MKITLGEWKTRDGRKAIVAAENPNAFKNHRLIGWLDGIGRTWHDNGLVCEGFQFEADIIAPWTEPVPWDWSTTPPWINWIAMNYDGEWCMHSSEPFCGQTLWNPNDIYHRIPPSYRPKWTGDWKLSKTMRPKEVAK